MVERIVPMQVGEVELLVATRVLPGSEQTSGRGEKAAQKALDSFDRVEAAVEAIAARMAGTLQHLEDRAVRPDQLAVEFGLSFTAEGGVLVAGASAEASLKVTVVYDRARAGSS